MKIIANIGKNTFLVEATCDELARLDGFSGGDWYRRNAGKQFGVGDKIDVNSLSQHHSNMKAIKDQISRAKGIIDTVSAGLTLADSIVEEAQVMAETERDLCEENASETVR